MITNTDKPSVYPAPKPPLGASTSVCIGVRLPKKYRTQQITYSHNQNR
ncbi:hypothetical protein [Fischerella thermalis]|nr:hypothetical protein [Fischerella thermalis]